MPTPDLQASKHVIGLHWHSWVYQIPMVNCDVIHTRSSTHWCIAHLWSTSTISVQTGSGVAAGEGRLLLLVLAERIAVARDETGLGAMPGLAEGLVLLMEGTCSMSNDANGQLASQRHVWSHVDFYTSNARAHCAIVPTSLTKL